MPWGFSVRYRCARANGSYYLNYNEQARIFSFVAYVKIGSKKRIKLLKSTRKNNRDSFENINELKNKEVPEIILR